MMKRVNSSMVIGPFSESLAPRHDLWALINRRVHGRLPI
jgi:hypothetical protein